MPASDVIARNLRRFREERALSMAELARQAGLSKQTIAGIEAGRANPTVDTLEELARTLGVSIRALMSELGSEILLQPGDGTQWTPSTGMDVRHLDQAFGSGYVYNSVLQLEANRGVSRHRPSSRGALRHCYVLDGRLRMGPENATISVKARDFVRFPADTAHVFEAITPVAHVFVCTTAPQLTMAGGDRFF